MSERVSIVIIGRNEEHAIGACAEAAIAAAEQIGGAEMIYVDSSSTDNTVAVMESHGFRCVQLPAEMRLSPSAGRHFGSRVAHGEFILFLDADTWVYKDFLPEALLLLDRDPSLAGCNGRIDDFTETGQPVKDVEELCNIEADVKWLRGPCCLYKRRALLQVGSFDPALATEEEAELGLRLVKAGWRLKKISQPMARHTRCYHGDSIESVFSTLRRDIRSRRLGEITRTISRAFQEGNGIAFCWLRLKTTILFTLWLALLLVTAALPHYLYPGLLAALIIILGVSALYLKKKDPWQVVVFILSKLVNLLDILSGIHKFERRKPVRDHRNISFGEDFTAQR